MAPHAAGTSAPVRWMEAGLLGFDTETTGVDPLSSRLVTAALIRRQAGSGQDEVTQWLADPGVEIPASAQQVHGISTQEAREHGRPVGQVLEEVADQLASAMRQGVAVVAFNASYDLTLLECELARHGLPTLRERLGGELRGVVDPLVLDRAVDRYRKGKRNLGVMCEVYGVRVSDRMHAADVDVIATLDVLEAMVEAYPELGGMDLPALMDFQAQAHRRWAVSFNEWLTRRGRRPDADPSWPLAGALG